MEQHPIPQNVSSYQFKLVGDMTLKQFFQVAGGVLAGIIFYSTPLLAIIRYPLALVSILLGIGLAFLPLEERPLEKWIFAFFRAIYAPTLFSWQNNSVAYKFFQDEPDQPVVAPGIQPHSETALKNYLATTNQVPTAPGNLDKAESGFLARLSDMFKGAPTTPPVKTDVVAPQTTTPSTPATTNTEVPIIESNAKFVSVETQTPTPIVTTQTETPIKQDLVIPNTEAVKIQPTNTHVVVEETPAIPSLTISHQVLPVVAGNEMISTKQAMFSIDAAPPSPPTYPNVVVGQIVDQDRKMIEGAIMEIRDSAGRPIRALRSNKVGHFITVTQLDNGHYEIITEKDGYEFIPVNFDAVGTLIQPILVQGKRLGPAVEAPSVIVKPAYSIN